MGVNAPHPMVYLLSSAAGTQNTNKPPMQLLSGSWYIQITGATTPASTSAFKLLDLWGASATNPGPIINRGDGGSYPQYPHHFEVQIEAANGRYRIDGVNPTTSVGMILFNGNVPTIVTDWQVLGSTLAEAQSNIRFIGSAGAIFNFHFFD